MGSYSSLYINGFELITSKSMVSDIFMSIFSEEHKKINIVEIDGDEFKEVSYCMKSMEFSDRLNIMGFTYENARKDFQLIIEEDDDLDYFDDECDQSISDFIFEEFVEQIKIIIGYNLSEYSAIDTRFLERNVDKKYHSLIKYMLNDYSKFLYGFPLSDPRYLAQIITGISDDFIGEVEYDVSQLVDGGYYDIDFEFSNSSKLAIKDEYIKNQKIIVLTEGKTDVEVLQKSLEILYPHLTEYFSFLDFNIANLPGSTNEMVRIVKTFIASGIANRTVAIFDNDTAGEEAIIELGKLSIPRNIKLMKYPELDYTKNYPTIGPQGEVCMNINGLACSIELYFGKDVLIEDNKYIPIQWTGYNGKLKRYQGEILYKTSLKKRFFNMITSKSFCKEKFDFQGINKILKTIFNAFNEN